MSSELLDKSRSRLFWAGVVLVLGAALLSAQLLRWALWAEPTRDRISSLLWIPRSLEEQRRGQVRGSILDRDGALLVTTGARWDISVTPQWVPTADAPKMAAILAPLLDLSQEELTAILETDKPYAYLNQVSYETGMTIKGYISASHNRSSQDSEEEREIKSLSWDALQLEPVPIRLYPEGSLAAHVLGFINGEGKAFYGVERRYDQQLRGEVSLDLTRQGIPLSQMGTRFEQNASPDAPCDIILTIDRAAQYVAERVLRETIEQYAAEQGTILVMDPKTGGLLASASYPTYEPGNYADYLPEVWDDPAVSEQYEPGSVFKIVTMAAGLNSGVISPSSSYLDTGCTYVGGRQICNLDMASYGWVDMQDVLNHSLNLGTTFVSTTMGPDNFYAYVEWFGFGAKTGIDLANEVSGQVRTSVDANWYESDLAANSFGQGIAVTPVQMITAVSAVANRGFLMQPHVVKGIIANGKAIEIKPNVVRQVIREDTAATLTDMMVTAVDRALPAAQVKGYSVAGKTGTADIPGPQGYQGGGTIASFAGFLPASDPQFVILVTIVRPRGETLGGTVAAPAFQRVAQQLVAMGGVAPDRSD